MQKYIDLQNFFDNKLILASKSPRRQKIISKLGISFDIHPSDYEEESIPEFSPSQLVKYHSFQKAQDVSKYYNNNWIVGADTIVVLEQEIIEKPDNREKALEQLQKLSGQKHKVITGFTILNSANQNYIKEKEVTTVYFREITKRIIEYYLDNYKYKDKAGSYAIQDFASIFIKKIEGSYYNVVGLPISEFFWCINNTL